MTDLLTRPILAPWTDALLRIGFGLTLATHGWPKLLGQPHGSMADPMAGSIRLIGEGLGLPFAPAVGMFIALLEGIGGLLLAAGLATRPLALSLDGLIGPALARRPAG